MEYAVEVKNVSVLYMIGDFKDIGLKEYVLRKISGNYQVKEFWADKNISFNLEKGDMLGLIGTNGAGKSTLLKVITGIMAPSEGYIKTSGRIAALLELASGFEPELTVKENVFLRGALMGYKKKYIQEKYQEIIEFSELEDFQDHYFKQLSSGMKSRLAFSIACLVNPDILILDEVLSVGDGYFRRKSGDRMKNILRSGVTGILVSHSAGQVRELCNKVLWLDHGKQVVFGDTHKICNAYEHFLATPSKQRVIPNSEAEINEISIRYDLYKALSEEELRNSPSIILKNEPITVREQRWMKYIDSLNDEDRQKLLVKHGLAN